jgi:2-amino-4-hydroxy-6-hydroxymethyldihydropteridine diphosphokinase
MEKEAAIALGSNLGDREGNLKRALNAISNIPKLKIERISSVYETLPFETPDEQSNYYNCCAVLKTELKPEILLGACFGIEAALGRVRTYQNAARIIDLDLLFYEGESFSEKDLQVPHPII